MENKYTSGEWYAKEGQIYPIETGKTIAVIPYFDSDNEEHKANEKIIAAAPDLLEALQALHSVIMTSNDRKIFDNGLNAEIVAKAKLAINKAIQP